MTRKFERDYRVSGTTEILQSENAFRKDVDLRLDSLEGKQDVIDVAATEARDRVVRFAEEEIAPKAAALAALLETIEENGYFNAPIAANTTAAFALGQTTVTIHPASRTTFVPSPWVSLARDANATDYVLARRVSYNKATGALVLDVTNLWGNPGSYADVTVWAVAGGALSALDSAAHVAADRTAVAADRAAAEQAAADVHAAQILIAGGPVASFNGRTGPVTLEQSDVAALITAFLNALPTSLPASAGQWWLNDGLLQKS